MSRARFLSVFSVLLLGGGIVIVGEQAYRVGIDAMAASLAGVALLVLGGAGATLSLFVTLASCRRLRSRLGELTAQGRLAQLEASDSQLQPLVSSINQLVHFAEESIADASMRLKENQIQLKVANAQRQHAQAILYSISDAVLVTDRFDEVVLANESAARTFGFDLAASTRRHMDQLVGDETVRQLIRDMRKSSSANERRIIEHQLTTGEGRRTVKATLSCITDQSSEPSGVVTVLHDMTREKEVAQMKNDFVSNVSHELRTPLASIKAYVEMLIDGEADDEKTKSEFYDVIQNEANRLGRLIDNILNISRIESGLVKINKQPQSLTVILKEAIEVIGPQAKLKQIVLDDQLTPVFYQTVADKDMLYQAVLNLLSNSVKYTPEGGRIGIQTVVDETKRKVITRITDSGVGIPPKDLPFVFDKFYRVEANSRMAKGTGLGLSLVKHIIETVHHGRVFVESEIGKGSVFGFELDLAE